MSALLLTVVVLGLCFAAVVADVLWALDQPATDMVERHRGGPWHDGMRLARTATRRSVAALGHGMACGAEAIRRLDRRVAAGLEAGRDVARDGARAIGARRRALAQRHAAHARHLAHLRAAMRGPSAGPLPPVPEAQAGITTTSQPPAPPHPAPPRPATVPTAAVARPATGRLLRERRTTTGDQRRRRRGRGPVSPPPPIAIPSRASPQPALETLRQPWVPRADAPDPGPAVPLSPPTRIRVRSAIVLVLIMGMLGVLLASLVLMAIFVVVQVLAGL